MCGLHTNSRRSHTNPPIESLHPDNFILSFKLPVMKRKIQKAFLTSLPSSLFLFKFFQMLLLLLIAAATQAQDQSVLSAAGGSSLTPNYTLDWTMGEYAVETITTANKMYTQGFHQPLQVVAATNPVEKSGVVYNISIAPNPVVSILNFSISSKNDVRVFVTVTNIHGVIFKQFNVNSAAGSLQIDMNGLPPGTYTLIVRDGVSAHIIKTYLIIKA